MFVTRYVVDAFTFVINQGNFSLRLINCLIKKCSNEMYRLTDSAC